MKFSIYLKEAEQNMPHSQDVLYTCCILEASSQHMLIGQSRKWFFESVGHDIPKGWIGRSHHMTIKFKPRQTHIDALADLFGKPIELQITDFACDDYGCAVVVKPNFSMLIGQTPHVTVAHSREVGPVYSNNLLNDKSKWHPIKENIVLSTFVVAIKTDNSAYPMLPEQLAAPVLSL